MLSVLNDVPALDAENRLAVSTAAAAKALEQLSSGARINSGADDAAGLAISDGLDASVLALNQSAQNITDGIGLLQTADGALSQITFLLDRALTLAVEASNGTVNPSQYSVLFGEYASIRQEIDDVSTKTSYSGQFVFGNGATPAEFTIFASDGTSSAQQQFTIPIPETDSSSLGLSGGYPVQAGAEYETHVITDAIATVAHQRGQLGAYIEQLQAASAVGTVETQNLESASTSIRSADIGAVVAADTVYSVLEQTGVAALQQANRQRQMIVKLIS